MINEKVNSVEVPVCYILVDSLSKLHSIERYFFNIGGATTSLRSDACPCITIGEKDLASLGVD